MTLASPGAVLRSLAGIDESILRWVPHERARHTAVGGVVLGTAGIAALSMWFFIAEVTGSFSWFAVLPVALWFLFILNLDRWLVSSQIGTRGAAGILIMRVLIAVLFGVLIAEPLVLRVFSSAIEQNIQERRDRDADELRANLVRCNPDPTTQRAAPKNCENYLLSFPGLPTDTLAQLASYRKDAARLEKLIDRDTSRLNAISRRTTRECQKLVRIARTGLYTRTSECERFRSELREFRETHPIEQNRARLESLSNKIQRLEDQLAGARALFLQQRDRAIIERLAELRDSQKAIGLLERLKALEEFARGNWVLLIGIWLVRSFFIVIDCLPILVKFFGGKSAYDALIAELSRSRIAVHRESVLSDQRREIHEFEANNAKYDNQLRKIKSDLELDWREHVARKNIHLNQAVEDVARDILAKTASRANP